MDWTNEPDGVLDAPKLEVEERKRGKDILKHKETLLITIQYTYGRKAHA